MQRIEIKNIKYNHGKNEDGMNASCVLRIKKKTYGGFIS